MIVRQRGDIVASDYIFIQNWPEGALNPSLNDILSMSMDYGGNTPLRHNYILCNPKLSGKLSIYSVIPDYNYCEALFGFKYDEYADLENTEIVYAWLYIETEIDLITGQEKSPEQMLAWYLEFISQGGDPSQFPKVQHAYVRKGQNFALYPDAQNATVAYISNGFQITKDRIPPELNGLTTTNSADVAQLMAETPWDGQAPEQPDPYSGGGTSMPGGGGGSFDPGTGDVIALPDLPTIGGNDCGLWTIYAPTAAQLDTLSNYLWSPTFEQAIQKIFADPMQAIIGLSVVPFPVPTTQNKEIKIGNAASGVFAQVADTRYVRINCGSVVVPAITASYLDYAPHTKISLYLPYCGSHELDINECSDKAVGVSYIVDIVSGACVACVTVDGTVMYQYPGNCGMTVPLSSVSYENLISSALATLGALGATVASGGSMAPAAIGTIAAATVNGLEQHIQHSGAVSGISGWFGVQKPFLTVHFPAVSIPAYQNSIEGYPSNISSLLGALSGYTKCQSVDLKGVPATDAELSEIENWLLNKGVYL